jgi:hypothetical protein
VALADTRRWLERAVIGLNLCPFAKAVLVKQQVHFAASQAQDDAGILEDFLSFLDLVARAERMVRKRGLEGVVQVAHFHPRFVFAGTGEDDITNATNRAPYPTLHLLREASITRAVAAFPDPAAIYEANMATLRRLGREGWDALGVGPSP